MLYQEQHAHATYMWVLSTNRQSYPGCGDVLLPQMQEEKADAQGLLREAHLHCTQRQGDLQTQTARTTTSTARSWFVGARNRGVNILFDNMIIPKTVAGVV